MFINRGAKVYNFSFVRKFRNENFVQTKKSLPQKQEGLYYIVETWRAASPRGARPCGSSPVLLHQPLHLTHLALQESVDGNLAAVGVEGDGGEAGEGRVDVHAGDSPVRDELRVVVQQGGLLYCDALIIENDGGREKHIRFGNARSGKGAVHNEINHF